MNPPRRFGSGPCILCGHPSAEHRALDAITERIATGEPWRDVLADYGASTADFFGLLQRVHSHDNAPDSSRRSQ